MTHLSWEKDLPTPRTGGLGDDDLCSNNSSKLYCCPFRAELTVVVKKKKNISGGFYIIQCRVKLGKGCRKQQVVTSKVT